MSLFVGGTSTANEFNDYEEGTFTPALASGYSYANTITYAQQSGYYTKIGNVVHCNIYLRPNGNSAHSGNIIEDGNNLFISGLPFTGTNTVDQEGGGYLIYQNGFFDNTGTANENLHAYPWVPRNQSGLYFHTPVDGNNLKGNETNPNNRYLIFHVRYTVD